MRRHPTSDAAVPHIERPLSLPEVAAIFNRTPRSIRNWVKAGVLTPLAIPRGPFFDPAQIRALCALSDNPPSRRR